MRCKNNHVFNWPHIRLEEASLRHLMNESINPTAVILQIHVCCPICAGAVPDVIEENIIKVASP